jgi:hypothetical protein
MASASPHQPNSTRNKRLLYIILFLMFWLAITMTLIFLLVYLIEIKIKESKVLCEHFKKTEKNCDFYTHGIDWICNERDVYSKLVHMFNLLKFLLNYLSLILSFIFHSIFVGLGLSLGLGLTFGIIITFYLRF